MNKPIRNVIVTRELHETMPGGKTVLLQIAKPRMVTAKEWECAFYLTNIGMTEIQFGHGIDSVQALIQAIEGARVFLEKSGKELIWEGGKKGETGIPRYVPAIYGKNFTEHLYRIIDCELEGFARSAELRNKE